MEIKYLGHASFFVKGREAKMVFDPFTPTYVGLPFKSLDCDIVCVSHDHDDHNNVSGLEGNPYVIKGPGEYEVKGVNIVGIQSFHDEEDGKKRGRNTIYLVEMDGLFLCHLGDLGHKLSDSQLSLLDKVDILFVPVGGFYTIDSKVAVEVISQIEPRIIIPMHYRVTGMKPNFNELSTLEDFLKEVGETPRFEQTLKIGKDDVSQDQVSLVVLETPSK